MALATYTALDALRVGVIDDNAYFRRIMRSMLNGMGVRQLLEAANMDDGWDIIVRGNPDIILIDWNLGPNGDGARLVERIRSHADEVVSTMSVIFLSAHSDKRHVLTAVRLGANDFIVKPISAKLLYERLRRQTQVRLTYARRSGRLVPLQPAGMVMPPPPPSAARRPEPHTAGGVFFL